MQLISKLYKAIRYKVFELVIKKLIIFSVLIDTPALTARIVSFTRVAINNPKTARYRALCMRRSIFVDDLRAMADYSGRIQYFHTLRAYWRTILNCFLPHQFISDISEDNYYTDERWYIPREKYRTYLERMWPYLQKHIKFDVILSANFGYVSQQELASVSVQKKIPFIVLYKEGMTVPGKHDEYMQQYTTRKFIGSALLVYNEETYKALLRAAIPGITKDNTYVIGIPRLDPYIRKQYEADTTKRITFFTFYIKDKFRTLVKDSQRLDELEEHATKFYSAVLCFTKNHPEIEFVFSTKLAPQYMAYVQQKFNNEDLATVSNVSLTTKIDVHNAIRTSQIIIGFNSTTLIEAILAKKNIITPYFGDIVSDISWDYFNGFKELVSYIKNVNDIEKAYTRMANGAVLNETKRQAFLRPFIYRADGNASIRAEDMIIQYIQNNNEKNNLK